MAKQLFGVELGNRRNLCDIVTNIDCQSEHPLQRNAIQFWESISATIKSQDDFGINVWFIPHEILTALDAVYAGVLSTDERLRFDRIVIRAKSISRRGARVLLRRILSIHLDCQPEAIVFEYSNFGRPSVLDDQGVERVFFSISHTSVGSLVSVSPRVSHAVDIEYARQLEIVSLKHSVLTDLELKELATHSAVDMNRRFFEYWTCKEAVLKHHGPGLSVNPKELTIQLSTQETPMVTIYPKSFNAGNTSSLMIWREDLWVGAIASSKDVSAIQLISPFPVVG